MTSTPQPLVAVMTPVYNGADSLAACLESVRAQNYKNWIHLVADNASVDGSRQIAEQFAAQDPRVKVLSFRELLPMLENFNRALDAVPPSAVYLNNCTPTTRSIPPASRRWWQRQSATLRLLSSSVASIWDRY